MVHFDAAWGLLLPARTAGYRGVFEHQVAQSWSSRHLGRCTVCQVVDVAFETFTDALSRDLGRCKFCKPFGHSLPGVPSCRKPNARQNA